MSINGRSTNPSLETSIIQEVDKQFRDANKTYQLRRQHLEEDLAKAVSMISVLTNALGKKQNELKGPEESLVNVLQNITKYQDGVNQTRNEVNDLLEDSQKLKMEFDEKCQPRTCELYTCVPGEHW